MGGGYERAIGLIGDCGPDGTMRFRLPFDVTTSGSEKDKGENQSAYDVILNGAALI